MQEFRVRREGAGVAVRCRKGRVSPGTLRGSERLFNTLLTFALVCGFFALYMAPALFVYCIVTVVWSGSVVSLLYEAIYSSVSCARLKERVRGSLVSYHCLLQIIIAEFPHFVRRVWVSDTMACRLSNSSTQPLIGLLGFCTTVRDSYPLGILPKKQRCNQQAATCSRP